MFDGSEVSHAALCFNDQIAEALIKEGLIQRSIWASIADCDWVEVRRLRATVDTMSPVLGVARAYLEDRNRYAYEQIVLLDGMNLFRHRARRTRLGIGVCRPIRRGRPFRKRRRSRPPQPGTCPWRCTADRRGPPGEPQER